MDKQEIIEKLNNLRNSIDNGVLETEYQGKKVRYRSLQEMRQIESNLQKQLSTSRNEFKKVQFVFEKF